MGIVEFVVEVVFQFFVETVPKHIGVASKWFFYGGKKPVGAIKKENWNTRIGLLIITLAVALFF